MNDQPPALLLKFPGTNCDAETARALQAAGFTTTVVPISLATPEHLKAASLVVFSGGFSYGDYVMAGRIAQLVTERKLGHALQEFAPLNLPLMTGPSRKSFLARTDPEENRFATAAAVTASILGGAHIVRVHDVREMRAAADVADEILRVRAEMNETEPPRTTQRATLPRSK